jgi:protein AATF/BFR2
MSKDEDLDDLEHEFSDSEDNFPLNPRISDEREEVRRLMSSDQKMVSATISQATKADAVKGIAVKQQRATFDGLLNTRIKLQKGLMAINDLSSTSEDITSADEMAIKSAESAALALWSTIEDLRLALADSLSKDQSKKRKRPSPVSSATPSASLWKRMTDLESESLAQRRTILDKWSLKVRGSTAVLPNARGKLLGDSGNQQMLTAVIDAHIASESGDRPVKRHRQIRLPNGNDEAPEPLYDDAVFYQSLLRDLVEQRMSSSDAITNGIDSLHLQLPPQGMRKDKIKKAVDTKASKGRKMRYNVHEKLQNFMAPEDRGTWSIKAREEFFSSLLGKTASGLLGEDNVEERMNGATSEDSEVEKEEGLRLFRSS